MEYAKQQVQTQNNWSKDYVNQVFKEFERFMVIKYFNNNCSPSDDVDLLWHQIILDTKLYQTYCKKKFKRIIHHTPKNSQDQVARKARLSNTIKYYKIMFNETPNPKIWQTENLKIKKTKKLKTNKNTNTANTNKVNTNIANTDSYQIYVKDLTGKTYALDVNKFNTILEVKEKIYLRDGIPIDQQRLIKNGTCLEDNYNLEHYSVKQDSTITVLLKLGGC